MTTYVLRRILQAIPLLLVISLVLFTILQLLPEKPWDLLLRNPRMTAADRARLLHYYGFDQPFLTQYLTYMRNLLHFDLGFSYFSHQTTVSLIAERLPNTLLLMGTAYLFTLLVAIPLGIVAAVKQYSKLDNVLTTGAFIGISLPQFWFGLMLIILLSVLPYQHLGFRLFPTDGMWDSGHEGNLARLNLGDPVNLAWHLVLPGIVLAVQSIAQYSRFVRSSMLDVMSQDFIR